MLPWGSMPDGQKWSQVTQSTPLRPYTHTHTNTQDRPYGAGQGRVARTRPIGNGLLGVQLLGADGGPRFEFGFGELGQVGHDGVLIHVGVHNFLWGNHLSHVRKIVHKEEGDFLNQVPQKPDLSLPTNRLCPTAPPP